MKLVFKALSICLIIGQFALAQNENQRSSAPGTDPNVERAAPGDGGFEAGVPAVGCIDPSKGCFAHSAPVKRIGDSTTVRRDGSRRDDGPSGTAQPGTR